MGLSEPTSLHVQAAQYEKNNTNIRKCTNMKHKDSNCIGVLDWFTEMILKKKRKSNLRSQVGKLKYPARQRSQRGPSNRSAHKQLPVCLSQISSTVPDGSQSQSGKHSLKNT